MTLRFRLTLVSTIVLMVVLTSFGGGVYILMNRALHDNLDQAIARYTNEVVRDYPFGPSYTGRPDYIAQVVSSGGTKQPIPPLTSAVLPVDERVLQVAAGETRGYYTDITLGSAELRMRVVQVPNRVALLVATSRESITQTLRRLRFLLAWAGAIGIIVAAMLAWSAARTALRPVEDVADAATGIGHTGDLSRRVAPGGEDELGKLTQAFNGMLDRLEAAQDELQRTLEGQRRFLADASHELRTPLTTMRGNLEVIGRSPGLSAEDLKAALQDSIEEAQRMSRLVDDLLALARADAAEAPVVAEPVTLSAVARDAIALAATADQAEGGDGPHVNFAADDAVVVQGSPDLLRRLVTNLVENAIKYTPAPGRIDVSVSSDNGWAVLSVADTGIGMSDEELAHAFDRFWRSDRSRGERGSGLGLAIARSVAEDHGGAIAATSEPGRGTTMTVRLPLRASGV